MNSNNKKLRKAVFAWDMHYNCNYRCPYCFYTVTGWEELAKKNVYKSPEEWQRVWGRMHEHYGRCRLFITAGEPFTYPRFVDVIEKVSVYHDIQISSNCSRTQAVASFACRISPDRVKLDCAFHPLQCDFKTFLNNVLALRNKGFTANVCYLAYPPQIPQMKKWGEKFMEHGIRMNLAVFWGQHNGKKYPQEYSQEEKAVIRKVTGYEIGPETVGLDPIPVKGKICGAGQRYAVIQADGKAYRCGQIGCKEDSLGSIFDENFNLFETAKPCTAEFCTCKEYQSAWEEEDVRAFEYG